MQEQIGSKVKAGKDKRPSMSPHDKATVREYLRYKIRQCDRAIARCEESASIDPTKFSTATRDHWKGVRASLLWSISGLGLTE